MGGNSFLQKNKSLNLPAIQVRQGWDGVNSFLGEQVFEVPHHHSFIVKLTLNTCHVPHENEEATENTLHKGQSTRVRPAILKRRQIDFQTVKIFVN